MISNNNEEEKTKKVKKELTPKQKIGIFWGRVVGFLGIGVGCPFGIFAWQFGLFNETTTTYVPDPETGEVVVKSVTANGWLYILLIMAAIFAIYILNTIKEAMPKGTMARQCIDGFRCVVLPIGIAIAFLYVLDGCISQILTALCIILPCLIMAIPINPFPKWLSEHDITISKDGIKKVLKKLFTEKDK